MPRLEAAPTGLCNGIAGRCNWGVIGLHDKKDGSAKASGVSKDLRRRVQLAP